MGNRGKRCVYGLKSILAMPVVVGYERRMCEYLLSNISRVYEHADIINEDDNLFVYAIPRSPKLVYSIHIDRHGFYVVDENYVIFDKEKFRSKEEAQKIAKKYENEIVCVYSPKMNIKLGEGKLIKGHLEEIESKNDKYRGKILYEVLWFNIQQKKKPKEGYPVVFSPRCGLSKGYIYGQLDNGISIGAIFNLLYKEAKEKSKNISENAAIIFTTKEEIGESWKNIKKFYEEILQEDLPLIALDVKSFKSKEMLNDRKIIIRSQDRFSKFDDDLVGALSSILNEQKIAYKIHDSPDRGTEVGRALKEIPGIRAATVQIPTIYNHTPHEMTTTEAFETYREAIKEIASHLPKYM